MMERSTLFILGIISFFLLTRADVIGDGLSSKSSNQEFFSTMDTNLDGTVEESEVREIVSAFGGGSLDEPEEIKRSVENVFAQLDTNQDGTLTVAESHSFWHHLGALLSVNEVAAWVVHGIQMPESVGEIFRSNAVSGYDFAELLEDNGSSLEELGITRTVHKKKLMRSIRMLMSGVGIKPTPPGQPQVEGISCHSAKVSWQASDGGGFPVHKYRVFRHSLSNIGKKKISLLGNNSQNPKASSPQESSSTSSTKSKEDQVNGNALDASAVDDVDGSTPLIDLYSQSYTGGWVLVYEGPSTDFIDTGLMSGFRYEYQSEAWSLFGHSSMSSFSGSSWNIDKDINQPCQNQYSSSSILTDINRKDDMSAPPSMAIPSVPLSVIPLPPSPNAWRVTSWPAHMSPYSTKDAPPFFHSPQLALPPPNLLGNMNDWNLEGVRPSVWSFEGMKHLLIDGVYALWWLTATLWTPLAFLVTLLSPIFGIVTALMRVRRGSMNHKRDKADRVHADITWRVLAFIALIVPGAAYLIPKSLRSDPALIDMSIKNDGSASPAAVGTSGVRHVRPPEMGHRKSGHAIIKNTTSNNESRCAGCQKRFRTISLASLGGFVRMRPKHTCSSCWAVFCGSCGYTSHTWLMTCPVGGGCLCNSCNSSVVSHRIDNVSCEPNSNATSNHMLDPMTKSTTTSSTSKSPSPSQEESLQSPVPVMKPPPRPGTSFMRTLSRSTSLGNIDYHIKRVESGGRNQRANSDSESPDSMSLSDVTGDNVIVTATPMEVLPPSSSPPPATHEKGKVSGIPRNLSKTLFKKS